MNNTERLAIDSDYGIRAVGQTTGTGWAGRMEGRLSHDQIQRLLSTERVGSGEWWPVVKP